jgi:dTDP-4-amino-4,6-dideoxygalactose transaminase
MATLSFHETKNIISGEGGALLINSPDLEERAEIIREKGTNRSQFFRGQVDKYTWVDIGSSYLPSDIIAAFLLAQLEYAEEINSRRLLIWETYNEAFESLELSEHIRRPVIPSHCEHNAHMYYLLLPDLDSRSRFISGLKKGNIQAVFHYVPLHSSPMGHVAGNVGKHLPVTQEISDRLVRLPLWLGLEPHLDRVIDTAHSVLQSQ